MSTTLEKLQKGSSWGLLFAYMGNMQKITSSYQNKHRPYAPCIFDIVFFGGQLEVFCTFLEEQHICPRHQQRFPNEMSAVCLLPCQLALLKCPPILLFFLFSRCSFGTFGDETYAITSSKHSHLSLSLSFSGALLPSYDLDSINNQMIKVVQANKILMNIMTNKNI